MRFEEPEAWERQRLCQEGPGRAGENRLPGPEEDAHAVDRRWLAPRGLPRASFTSGAGDCQLPGSHVVCTGTVFWSHWKRERKRRRRKKVVHTRTGVKRWMMTRGLPGHKQRLVEALLQL